MPPKKTANPKFGRLMNMKVSELFSSRAKMSAALRAVIRGRCCEDIAFAVQSKALTIADVYEALIVHANGEQTDIDNAILELLKKACDKDAAFMQRVRLFWDGRWTCESMT